MSDGHLLPNSAFSDIPIREAAAAAPAGPGTGRELSDILAPIDDGADRADGAAEPPYPFSSFSLFREIQTSQSDARDLLGL